MPLFGKKDGASKVDSVLGQFQEMQAELADGQDLLQNEINKRSDEIVTLERKNEMAKAKRDEAEALEAGLRALTNGMEGM